MFLDNGTAEQAITLITFLIGLVFLTIIVLWVLTWATKTVMFRWRLPKFSPSILEHIRGKNFGSLKSSNIVLQLV